MEEMLTMADLMAEVDKTMKRIYRGDNKKATVVSVEDSNIVLNIGYHADAILPWREVSFEEVSKDDIKVGDEFEVQVLRIDDGEGNVLVSKRRAESEQAFGKVESLYTNKEKFTVKIKEAVKGGVTTSVKGVRAFIPGSQLTDTYVADLKDYVGKEIEVEIIEFNPQAKKLVLSGKAIAKAKSDIKRKERLETIVVGEKYEGTITKLMPYGAFVNIGGIEGLVHNSDLSWTRIKHPSDVVKEGQKVEVTILSIDKEKGKIGLGIKDASNDPWVTETANFEVGQIVTGKVVKFMTFGAFVRIAEHVEGLVHISQIANKRIAKPEEVLELGQEVTAKIVNMDRESKKIGLSITEATEQVAEVENTEEV
ncbi:MAG: 30S ribosomal protein S1 [Cellulosilyticaceae bacterium]